MSYFDPSAPSPITVPGLNLHGAVEFVGVDGNPRTEFNTYWGDIGPRFGFAYNVWQRTTVRGGYGIYYDPSDVGVVGNAVTGGFLGYDAITPGVNNVPSDLRGCRSNFCAIHSRSESRPRRAAARERPPAWGRRDRHPGSQLNQAPQEQSWSFDIQHQLPGSILLDAGYIGRKGTHLYAMGYGNQLDALPPNVADAFRADPVLLSGAGSESFLRRDSNSADLSGPTIPRWKLYVPYPQYSNG
jgi:hypothetical protein